MCYVHFIKQRFAQHTRTHTQETWCRDTHATANLYQHGLNIGAYSLVPLQLWSSLSLRQRWSVSHQRLWFCAALCLFSCFRLLNNLLRNIHIYTRETWCCDISPRPIAKSRRHTHTRTHTHSCKHSYPPISRMQLIFDIGPEAALKAFSPKSDTS